MDRESKYRRTLFKLLGVQEIHLQAVYDKSPSDTQAMKAVRAWVNSDKSFLVLSGGPGVGKSAAAAWAVTQTPGILRRVSREVACVLKSSQLQRYFGFDQSNESAKRWLQRAPLVVVEELGQEYDAKGFFAAEFASFVDDRYGSQLPTIITTNMTLEEFKREHPRLADRMRESGMFFLVSGSSIRKA